MRLDRVAMHLGIEALGMVALVRLRMLLLPGRDLILVDQDLAALDPSAVNFGSTSALLYSLMPVSMR